MGKDKANERYYCGANRDMFLQKQEERNVGHYGETYTQKLDRMAAVGASEHGAAMKMEQMKQQNMLANARAGAKRIADGKPAAKTVMHRVTRPQRPSLLRSVEQSSADTDFYVEP